MLARIVSALVLVPLVLGAVRYAPPRLFLFLLAVAGTLCLREFLGLVRALGLPGRPWAAHGALWVLLLGFELTRLPPLSLATLIFLGAFIAELANPQPMRERVAGLAAEVLGVAYLVLGLYPLQQVRFGFGELPGRAWVVLLLATIWVGDTAALFAGRAFGRARLAPLVSPKKTIEGALGGLLAGVAGAVAVRTLWYPEIPVRDVVAAATVAGLLGQLGDLAESMLKRAAEMKDSSQLIPGHGGALDRLDSLLFAAPALYLYLLLLYRS